MKYSFYVLCAVLFLSCEEDKVDDLLIDISDENTPITSIGTLDTPFSSSSISVNWIGNEYAISFSHKLEPLSYTDTIQTYASWSAWDTVKTVTFTNLDDGEYIFYIKSRYTVEKEEAPQSRNFIVDAIAGPALRMYPLYQRVTSGENFSMYVYIEDVVDLAGVELHLSYPFSKISANTMTSGTILSSSPIFFDTINSADGTMELIAIAEEFTSFTGSGVLAKLTLSALSTGLDTLHINESSILKTSGNVPIDILDRVYGLIEVIE